MNTLCAMFLGFLLDLLLGDPHWMPHPVRFIGWLITKAERALRGGRPCTPRQLRVLGVAEVLLVVCICTAVPALLLWGATLASPWLALALETLMCYQIFAARALWSESTKVRHALAAHDLPRARHAVSMIVGRDTAALDEAGVARAAVETVAENASDGVVAPMLFVALGGAPLGFLYKAVNTMDSMLGYKNERYLHFGRAAAKLDDIVNWVPARISALLMIAAAFVQGYDWRGAVRIFRRDRFCHASPNSAQTESVCAGALGLRLAGDASYFGKVVRKPAIGDAVREIEPEDIARANRLMLGAALLTLMLCTAARAGVLWLLALVF